ncbi:MAG: hypothetical protein MJZ19_05925 [Paludibacteraceae bacterium]|nr:hypothetical protein [Paludibacteraceae bacterium]
MKALKKIRILIAFYMVALVLAGVTAFPAETELKILCEWISGLSETLADDYAIIGWLFGVRDGLIETNAEYPYIAYGYDWLAYAHIVIAMLFIGPFIDPIRNKWVVYWGMIACVTILPLAFICGPIREIPFIWTLIDCSFGVFGIMPLMLCIKYINRLEHERENNMF